MSHLKATGLAALCAMAAVLVSAQPANAANPVICSSTFDGLPGTGPYPSWTSSVSFTGNGSWAVSNPLSGGDPNGYQLITFSNNSGGQWEIVSLIDPTVCTYNPSTQGAITNVTISFNYQSADNGPETEYFPIIVQGGIDYRSVVPFTGNTTWQLSTSSGASASWCNNNGCTTHPNFTASGGPMTFGYMAYTDETNTGTGVDNYSVSITNSGSCDPPPTGTMVAWYPFDEFNGPTSENLATQNSATWSNPGPTPVAGEVGGALSFNGVDNYLQSPDSIVTNFGPSGTSPCSGGDFSTCQGDFSIDVWINIPSQPSGVEVIVDKRSSAPVGYEFYLYSDYISFQMGDASGFTNYSSSQVTITPNVWHLVAVTVNRTSATGITWYLDGAAVGTGNPTAHSGSLVNTSPLYIGATVPAFGLTSNFLGSMDELEMFNRVLTPAEIEAIHNARSNGKCQP